MSSPINDIRNTDSRVADKKPGFWLYSTLMFLLVIVIDEVSALLILIG